MLKETMRWFENRKIRHIALTVLADNQPARAVWDKMGFMDFYVFKWKVPLLQSTRKHSLTAEHQICKTLMESA
jgi:hypothetical protein